MEVFEGYSVNRGMVLASVAKVRFDFGIPSLTSQRLRSLGERLQREEEGFVETEQVILVAETFPTSLVASVIPGIEVIGVAVGEYVQDAELDAIDRLLGPAQSQAKGEDSFPIVAGLGAQFVRDVEEYEIVLVDGNAGRVFVAPDAFVVSKFQTKAERKRFFLEGEHIAAKTASDNRVVQVYSHALNSPDIEAGMAAGADGVYLARANTILSELNPLSADDQVATLHDMMDLAGGKPIILDVASTALAYSAVLEAAAGAPLSIVVDSVETASELRAALEMTRNFADTDDVLGEVGLLLGVDAPGSVDPLPENLDGFGGIVLADEWVGYDLEHVIPLFSLARRSGVPIIASLSENWADEIEDIVRFGAGALILLGGDAANVKDAIREL